MATTTTPALTKSNGSVLSLLTRDRAARWTSRLSLLVLWQFAGVVSERFPTPVQTAEILVRDFQTPLRRTEWSFFDNELVHNLVVSFNRTALAILIVIVIGVPIGYAMGRWWRVQAFYTDLVTVGLAMPAYMWALLAVMWFGFGIRAPVFCAVVSATPGLIVHVLQGSLSVPRDLRDMSDAFDVPSGTRIRNLVLPSMAAAIIAGIRLAIIAAWGCVVLVEWFGSNEGAGFRAREWYQGAANYNGLMAWGIVVLVVVIIIDRGIIERIDKAVHKWRGSVGGFGATKSAKAPNPSK
jgi:ABC-type nitrate/sulfonate/bicarbonate transport system permease component